MQVAVLRETMDGESRVALVPDVVERLVGMGASVRVQAGAGLASGHDDAAYGAAGATIGADAATTLDGADLVLKVQPPHGDEIAALGGDGVVLVSMLNPLGNPDGVKAIAERGITAFAMEMIPRISRAQSMDALSSMSTIAGYKAVLIAADHLPRFFPMLMTAAGTVAPARVLILGAGVAGLQAIATARRLGAVVSAFDTRAVVKEQVESLGATFLEIEVASDGEAAGGYARELTPEEQERQRELVAEHIAKSDVVITTALVPGRPAPTLITAASVEAMKRGSVIVDLASEAGGNCELTVHGATVDHNGVTIIGPVNLPSSMPVHGSQLYARNLLNLLQLCAPDGAWAPDWNDEIVAGTCVARDGTVVHPMLRERMGLPALETATAGAAQ
jgi:NAD(P) transhydrogenase subunit alpha